MLLQILGGGMEPVGEESPLGTMQINACMYMHSIIISCRILHCIVKTVFWWMCMYVGTRPCMCICIASSQSLRSTCRPH